MGKVKEKFSNFMEGIGELLEAIIDLFT